MDGLIEVSQAALGVGKQSMDITMPEMALRAAVTYVVTLAIVRVGKKRFMGSNTAFDVIVGIILGSTVSRGLTGNAPLASTLAAAAAIVFMHWLLSGLSLRWPGFSRLVKGDATMLVKNGTPEADSLRKTHMTQGDLEEELRSYGMRDASRVAEARLERSGRVSIIETGAADRVLEVHVADGVQTIRIQLASA